MTADWSILFEYIPFKFDYFYDFIQMFLLNEQSLPILEFY